MGDKDQQINDMIAAAADSSPSDFQNAFAAAMLDKIADSIEAKKIEVAKNYFNYEDDTETEVSDDTEEEPNEDTETAAGA